MLLPLVLLMLSSLFWFARVLLTRQMLATAARYGTDMILYTKLNEGQVRRELRNYLCDAGLAGRRLDSGKLPDENLKVRIKSFDPAPGGLLFPEKQLSSVEITYEFPLPRVFGGGKPLKLYGRSFVLAGTGCKNPIHGRNKGR